LRHHFFHNGALQSLREVVEFYATRDTDPDRWYGKGRKYNDLPPRYWANVNSDIPFKPLPNGKPRLSPRDIDDIVAFLGTLTDGYEAPASGPSRPRAPRAAAAR